MLKIFGIRHHGVGCSRALVSALREYSPDLVLIEGPPDAESALEFIGNAELVPPVAMLVYDADDPSTAGFYPFASFSPEWIALNCAKALGARVGLIDLPFANSAALEKEAAKASAGNEEDASEGEESAEEAETGDEAREPSEIEEILRDPLGAMARRAGVPDSQAWEERAIEQATSPGEIFDALTEACATLRGIVFREGEGAESEEEARREAHMRRKIREGMKSGAERIAVVCGAWHAPVLDLETKDPERQKLIPSKKEDDERLKNLPKLKTTATWTPWTYDRLARSSGYGAAIESPGWFESLWLAAPEIEILREMGANVQAAVQDDDADSAPGIASSSAIVRWTTRASRLLRREGFDSISTADAIEAARLAESLAAMRDRATPNVVDARDAILCALGRGKEETLAVVLRKLEIGRALGTVPSAAPTVPLERDLAAQIKKNRLKRSPEEILLKIDLREDSGRAKSALIHRVRLLDIPWATSADDEVRSLGTFRESWKLRWDPEFAVKVVEASRFGTTVETAASGAALAKLSSLKGLAAILDLFETALNAEVSQKAIQGIYERIERDGAVTTNVDELFEAIPPIVRLLRYGDSRGSDLSRLKTLFDSLYERLLVAIPGACSFLDEEASLKRVAQLNSLTSAIVTLSDSERLEELWRALETVVADGTASRIVVGRIVRILFEQRVCDQEELERKFGFFVSKTIDSVDVARWLQGFLSGTGQTLLWLDAIWRIFDRWLVSLAPETFQELVAILRRAFADFEPPERREMGKIVAGLKSEEPKEDAAESAPGEAASDSDATPSSGETESAAEPDQFDPLLSFILGDGEAPSEKPESAPSSEETESAAEPDQFDPLLSFILGDGE